LSFINGYPIKGIKGNMELSVMDRMTLLSVLPKEGDFTTLKIIRKLRETLSFTEEEHKKYNFVNSEGGITWSLKDEQGKDIPQDKDITIGEKATDIIVTAFKKLDREHKLNEAQLPCYEKFIKDV
jgi:hypothetical protein